jgi:NADPH:quinone reductase-like Zn-dependent oxidoreductase
VKAVQFTGHGSREVIEYAERPQPTPTASEVKIEVKAAALNHLDIWTRRGMPGLDLVMPHIPGSDAAGVVVEVGETVSQFDVGDRVAVSAGVSCGHCEFCREGEESLCVQFQVIGEHRPGVHSEYTTVHEDNLVPVPNHVDWAVAGSASLVFQTAWRMLVTRAQLSPTDSVLVLGASGGVGHAAVQIADHVGGEVYATASSEEKLGYAADLGADHVIDYTERDYADEIRDRTGKRGVDVLVDHIGGESWSDSLASLAKGGTLVTCGATAGGQPHTDVNRIFWNQLSVLGSTMATPGEVDDVLSLVWDGTFEPKIREVVPMSEAARAHEILENREGFGKVVLTPDREL